MERTEPEYGLHIASNLLYSAPCSPNDFRPALLGAQPLSDPPPYSEVDSTDEYGNQMEEGMNESVADPHADERQIKLDTDRSFVLYPGGTE